MLEQASLTNPIVRNWTSYMMWSRSFYIFIVYRELNASTFGILIFIMSAKQGKNFAVEIWKGNRAFWIIYRYFATTNNARYNSTFWMQTALLSAYRFSIFCWSCITKILTKVARKKQCLSNILFSFGGFFKFGKSEKNMRSWTREKNRGRWSGHVDLKYVMHAWVDCDLELL